MLRIARPDKAKIVPAFMVEKLVGKHKRELVKFTSKGDRKTEVVEEDAGYLVTFPKGHSIRVSTDAELHRLGFDQTIPLIDEDGDAVGEIPNVAISQS
jgi:hypothetical protein